MLAFALRNLLRARVRSLLTLCGITGSLALFVTLSTISWELKGQLDSYMARCRVDFVLQQEASTKPMNSRIDRSIADSVQSFEGVATAAPIVIGSVKIKGFPFLLLFGIRSDETYTSVADWMGGGLKKGRLFKPGKAEVIVGENVARRARIDVGDSLRLRFGQNYTVTGIYRLGEEVMDGGLLIDLDQSQELLKRSDDVNLILVEAQQRDQLPALQQRLQAAFPSLAVVPSGDLRGRIRELTLIDAFISAVLAIAITLSGLLLLNTLIMAVSERTREIGILRAIGWTRLRIIRLLITESVLLCLIGAAFGFALAFPILQMLRIHPEIGPGWIPFGPAWHLLPFSLVLALALGLCSALYPALHATRLQPADALRYE
jgi:putative ABC transport system permease protein